MFYKKKHKNYMKKKSKTSIGKKRTKLTIFSTKRYFISTKIIRI